MTRQVRNIALFGPPGVGKGTQAACLMTRGTWQHVATGDLLRENLLSRNELGLQARAYMDAGELVPDNLVEAMVEDFLSMLDVNERILFDGFPRTLDQVQFLEDLFVRLGRSLDGVFYLHASAETVTERLSGRLICPRDGATFHERHAPPRRAGRCDKCGTRLYRREDDTPDLIATRLAEFHRIRAAVCRHFARAGKLYVVDCSASIEKSWSEFHDTLCAVEEGRIKPTGETELPGEGETSAAPKVSPDVHRSTVDLVLFGGPGSGKGTQAQTLSRDLEIPHLATGDLFRTHLDNHTDLGNLAKRYMERGELVPDHVTEAMVNHRLREPDVADGFLLDGFPRSIHQAEALTAILHRLHRTLTGVIYIRVSDDEIVRRLSGRLICRADQSTYHTEFMPPKVEGRCDLCGGELYQRSDDNPETVKARLKTFHAQTEPLVDYYESRKLLFEVNGEGPVDQVAERIHTLAHRLADTAAADASE